MTQDQLNDIIGRPAHGPPAPAGTADEINAVVGLAGITTHLELAHFIAQFAYECAYFHQYTERSVPGQYEFRIELGNDQPGDGNRYRGRGGCQLTGKANYTAFQAWLAKNMLTSLDVVAVPDLVALPPLRWLAAAFYWSTHLHLRECALDNDVTGCTRIITGAKFPGPGQGLYAREELTERAIKVLG